MEKIKSVNKILSYIWEQTGGDYEQLKTICNELKRDIERLEKDGCYLKKEKIKGDEVIMKIDKFMLVDNCDSNYADLITFNTSYEFKEVEEVAQKVKDEKPSEYTNEDILKAISERFSVESVIDLHHIERVEY